MIFVRMICAIWSIIALAGAVNGAFLIRKSRSGTEAGTLFLAMLVLIAVGLLFGGVALKGVF